MAATNYTPISLYYSTTAAAAPSAGNLVNGELAINITDGKLFYKDNGGTVKVIAGAGGTGVVAGSNTQVQFNNSGVFGASADFTWDGTKITATGLSITGNTTLGDADTDTITLTAQMVTGTQIKTAKLGTNTLSLSAYDVDGAAYTNLITLTASNTPTLTLVSTGTGTMDNITIGATTRAAGSFTSITANADSSFTSTGALTISKGTTAERPSAAAGMLRFNTTTTEFEGYNGTAWASVGGAALSNDITTATDEYPLFASATSGTAATLYTSNAQYLFKPSTGELKVKAPVASNGIVVNADSVSSDYTIATGTNGFSVGPLTVNSGVTLTVASGQRHVVI